ncbi:MAG: DUF58 domain-containing protein [bacterium]|nr:DUF58 domain-containing protein [bacterium]
MSSSQKSQLMRNISRYRLDSRIGKMLLDVSGTGIRMGEHVSPRPGHSPVILDYRHYRNGDPLKDIDWKLSARTEKLFIKIREGYRQTDFVIAVDGSESMKAVYKSAGASKFITALSIAYITARLALKSRDRIHFLWHGDRIAVSSEQALTDLLVDMEFDGRTSDFWESTFIEKGTNIFIISDFFVEIGRFAHFMRDISHLSRNVHSFIIQDPEEKDFNFNGRYRFIDPESADSLLSETNDLMEKYHTRYQEHFAAIVNKSRAFGVKSGSVLSGTDPFNEFIGILS